MQGKLSIDPDNGKISVRKGIEMGQYSFIGIATNILHSKSATTKVPKNSISGQKLNLKVTFLQILLTVKRSSCDIKIEHVEKSLEILFLSENFEHNQIMPSEIGDCEFEIESVRPNYFKSEKLKITLPHSRLKFNNFRFIQYRQNHAFLEIEGI